MTAGFLVEPGAGGSVWSIGGRFTRKTGGDDTADRLSILEAVVTRTSEPRRHIHHHEDEAFYVLDGQLTFHVGEAVMTAATGSLAFAPMGIPHTFTVDIGAVAHPRHHVAGGLRTVRVRGRGARHERRACRRVCR